MRSRLALSAGIFTLAIWTVGAAQDQVPPAAERQQHQEGGHRHEAAAALKNPVKSTPSSIEAGKKLYAAQCSACHGLAGAGDGKMAASITGAKPADLTDASWKHGSTDGEIFTLIRDGSKGTGMRGYASRMKTEDIWNVVNYLRTLVSTRSTTR